MERQEKQCNTIEDIIQLTADNLRNLCAAPVQIPEGIRYAIAVNVQNLQKCLDAIEADKAAQAQAAPAPAEAGESEGPSLQLVEEEEPAPFEAGEDEE